MIRSDKWRGNKDATWSNQPTGSQILEQFSRYVSKLVAKYTADFRLSSEDAEDLAQDLRMKLFELPADKIKRVFFVLRSLRNAAATSMSIKFGVPRRRPGASRVSKAQRTLALDDITKRPEDATSRDYHAVATSITPDLDGAISMGRVRSALSGHTLDMFDFVLNDADKFSVREISRFGRSLGMTTAEISQARLDIVTALHGAGLLLSYPPPRTQFVRRQKPVERMVWLISLSRQFSSVEDAAQAAGITRNALNYHAKTLVGVSYPKFVTNLQSRRKETS